jgi:hypothetical protein
MIRHRFWLHKISGISYFSIPRIGHTNKYKYKCNERLGLCLVIAHVRQIRTGVGK